MDHGIEDALTDLAQAIRRKDEDVYASFKIIQKEYTDVLFLIGILQEKVINLEEEIKTLKGKE